MQQQLDRLVLLAIVIALYSDNLDVMGLLTSTPKILHRPTFPAQKSLGQGVRPFHSLQTKMTVQSLKEAQTDTSRKGPLGIDRGAASILGGFFSHLALGTIYCWGNFLSYSPQNLRFFDGVTRLGVPPDALYVLPITFLSQTIVMPFSQIVFKKIGAAKSLLLGTLIAAASVYLASFQTTLLSFILTYSVMFGIGLGIAYTAPMYAGWKWLPKRKGLVSGGVLAGFGGGGFLFSLLGSKVVNPKGLNPVGGVFPAEVYDRFPLMLRVLAACYAVLAVVGSLLVSEPKESKASSSSQDEVAGVTVKEALSSWQYWWMELMAILSATAGLNTVVNYKQLAATAPALAGDRFQALVGGIGAVFNGSGRFFWGNLCDMIGFKKAFTILTLLQVVATLAYPFSTVSKVPFALNTFLLFFCLAGNLALAPPAVQRMFGFKAGTVIYGILYSAFAIASILGGILTKRLVRSFGYETVFRVMAVMSITATVMVRFLKPLKNYKESSV